MPLLMRISIMILTGSLEEVTGSAHGDVDSNVSESFLGFPPPSDVLHIHGDDSVTGIAIPLVE